jgi:hypothetical protein
MFLIMTLLRDIFAIGVATKATGSNFAQRMMILNSTTGLV